MKQKTKQASWENLKWKQPFCFVLSLEQDYQKLEQEKDYKNDLLPMKTLDVESDLRYLLFL